ncbi:MAG: hypothetical protein AB8B96_04320 [Lysobacterales bacterium]
MAKTQTNSGVYEFVFGAPVGERDELTKFWQVLGFEPEAEGSLSAEDADRCYGHCQAVTSVRLKHPGCETFDTGYVRLQFWDELRNEGLGAIAPLVVGSRWMGLYTQDILQLRDSLASASARERWGLWVSPLVNAPLMQPPPPVDFYQPFVGLRETLVFGSRFRLAFIQRAGFDRPGFGTFAEGLAFSNTEGSHANIVQPANRFDSEFYKRIWGFETAPFGEAHDSGKEAPTIEALNLREGETFHIERTRAVDCPSGLLQIYSSYMDGEDHRPASEPGCGNLCAYSVKVNGLDQLSEAIASSPGAKVDADFADEFGQRCLYFHAPDGYAWIAVADVG